MFENIEDAIFSNLIFEASKTLLLLFFARKALHPSLLRGRLSKNITITNIMGRVMYIL